MDAEQYELVGTIPTQCVLGEGPVWDGRLCALWLTDIQQAQLLRIDWPSQAITRFDLPERLGSLGLTADPEQLVCAFASGFALCRPATGQIDWLFRTEPEYRGVRMNDGRVDRQGRFWAGSMVEREAGSPPERGSLWRLDRADRSTPHILLSGITISNSTCFSPAGDRLYFTDTPSQEIASYALAPEGSISDRRVFTRLAGEAYPDGSEVDAKGRLWNAEWGSGRVTAYNPDGSLFTQINLPVSQATCIAFGGPELDLLFVTTAREGLPDDRLALEPHAGDVLVYRLGVKGLPAPVFRG
ncbi:SMP-30/gluconolactonase/LRE family protein [Altererythrobacter sp. BO-6]|uniref:SMP-30/gluconolactonase/LRE family protein n=1 Tax=Altererythrobacter sp. BO-6 TaxID=2604537 RepID=UPI0013E128BD|nr:SMP-30/gluconolactonase/LRE family protein [Altererythrobacter sp. BO-6]QIG53522.1 SMP-30/gluconolactonase/LRE family protein [Altererythrobacter sp. BO-6]